MTARERSATTRHWRWLLAARSVALFALAAGACPSGSPTAPAHVDGVALDALAPLALSLPPSDPQAPPPAEAVAIRDWVGAEGGAHRAALPLRARGLFPNRPPPDLAVEAADGSPVPRCDDAPPPCWATRGDAILVRSAAPDPGPPSGLVVRSAQARARQARLDRALSGAPDDRSFARFHAWSDHTSRAGLLLGAPAEVAWDVDVPPASDLRLTAMLLPPEWADGPPSDGATVEVTVQVDGLVGASWSTDLAVGDHGAAAMPLDRWAGRRARVTVRTTSGLTADADYVFIADPAIVPRRARPRRVVLAFIDTLRADVTTVHDPTLATTPHLARIAAAGSTFVSAHSVAPWTLPAWRAAITGRLPTDWDEATSIAETLRERGWATAMFAGNVYLSATFGGDRGFALHRTALAPTAGEQVDAALAWLAHHGDRDALLVVHFMDPHLPYEEPATHRELFAGAAPDGWPEAFNRLEVMALEPGPAERAWIRGRYLNNVRYVDDSLARLDAALSPDDLLIVFSDHGEEFWDHGGFEHGHSLEAELVRVPLVVRGRGVPVGVFAHPTSLLDVAPTVLSWAGLPAAGLDGRDLRVAPEPDRALPLGHALYGHERWGVATPGARLSTVAGRAEIVREVEGVERRELLGLQRAAWLDRLARSHRAEIAPAVRVTAIALPGPSEAPARVHIALGVGFAAQVPAATPLPTDRLEASLTATDATVALPAGWRGAHELMLIPAEGPGTLTITVETADGRAHRAQAPWPPADLDDDAPWLESEVDGLRLTVGPGLAVRPGETPLTAFDPAQADALRALGYVEP